MEPTLQLRRRSVRLRDYDYRQSGAYFVTICTRERECSLGEVVDGQVRLSLAGQIVRDEWLRSAQLRPGLRLDAFVVMPNHLHGIIWLLPRESSSSSASAGENGKLPPPTLERSFPSGLPGGSLGAFVANFKAAVTRRLNPSRESPAKSLWQRSYFEHVIRDTESLDRIRRYIEENPARWEEDRENPLRVEDRVQPSQT